MEKKSKNTSVSTYKVFVPDKSLMWKDIHTDVFDNTSKPVSIKNDRLDNKLMWELLPLLEMEDIVRVYTAGAKKYGPNKWQTLDDGYNRYKAALFRHLLEYEKGNAVDKETGCLHLAQVAWNAISMLFCSKNAERCPSVEQTENLSVH